MNGRGFSPSYANLVKESQSKKPPYARDARGGREPRGVFRSEQKQHEADLRATDMMRNSIKSPQ